MGAGGCSSRSTRSVADWWSFDLIRMIRIARFQPRANSKSSAIGGAGDPASVGDPETASPPRVGASSEKRSGSRGASRRRHPVEGGDSSSPAETRELSFRGHLIHVPLQQERSTSGRSGPLLLTSRLLGGPSAGGSGVDFSKLVAEVVKNLPLRIKRSDLSGDSFAMGY